MSLLYLPEWMADCSPPKRVKSIAFDEGETLMQNTKWRHDFADGNGPVREQFQGVRVPIRWMIQRDIPEVFKIEKQGFPFPWTEKDFIRCLRQRNCINQVAEYQGRVVGFVIYALFKARIELFNCAVAADYRRRGVGSQMVARLIAKLSWPHRTRIILEVRETNLAAQLFFRRHGFRCVDILRCQHDETTEDTYVLQFATGREGG